MEFFRKDPAELIQILCSTYISKEIAKIIDLGFFRKRLKNYLIHKAIYSFDILLIGLFVYFIDICICL